MHPGLYASCDILFFFFDFFSTFCVAYWHYPWKKNVPSLTLWHISCGLSGNLWDISTCKQWDEIISRGKSYFQKPVFSPDYCFNYIFFASGMAIGNFRELRQIVGNPEPHSTWPGSGSLVFGLFWCKKMLISTFCMRDASVLPEKLLFDNIDGTCTTKEICIWPSVLPDKLCYKYNILCQCYQTNSIIN